MSCKEEMEAWRVQSPEEPGFHAVITPDTCACQETRIYRLNLPKGESYRLESGELEMHPVLISGAAVLAEHEGLEKAMKRFDAFYIPGGDSVTITAAEDCVFYIAAAVYEGFGKAFFRAFEKDAPVGDIHQIHGEGIGQRVCLKRQMSLRVSLVYLPACCDHRCRRRKKRQHGKREQRRQQTARKLFALCSPVQGFSSLARR